MTPGRQERHGVAVTLLDPEGVGREGHIAERKITSLLGHPLVYGPPGPLPEELLHGRFRSKGCGDHACHQQRPQTHSFP